MQSVFKAAEERITLFMEAENIFKITQILNELKHKRLKTTLWMTDAPILCQIWESFNSDEFNPEAEHFTTMVFNYAVFSI